MDEGSGLEGPLNVLLTGCSFILKGCLWLLSWLVSLVYILLSPVIYLANALLAVVAFPLRIILKFEV